MVRQSKSPNDLVVQGSILAAAALIVRLIGFFYRIPLVNLLGEEGMGYYSSAFEIYSLLLIISSYALPAAISKIISKQIALKKYKEANHIFRASLLLGLLIGLIMSLFLYFQAENIASFTGVTGSVYAMKALAPALLIFSILAVFRGYFQGMNTMVPTAISQIIEQVFNAIFSLSMAYVMLKQGMVYGAAGGTLGTGIGALFGLLFLVMIYRMAKPMLKRQIRKDSVSTKDEGILSYWHIIVITAVPMIIGSTAYNLSNIVDMIMFQRALFFHGHEEAYVAAQYGLLASKYRLILTLPISIASALAAASIPSITSALVKKAYIEVKNKAKFAIRIVLMISIPSACGLGFLARPILTMLFGTTSIDIATKLMQIGAVSIVFFSLSAISIGILQGINLIKIPLIHSIIALGIKVIIMGILLYVFDFGLMGAVITNIIFSIIVAVLNFRSIQKHILLNLNYKVDVAYPSIAGIIMGIVAVLIHMMIVAITHSNTIGTLIAIMVAIIVYFVILVRLGGLREADLASMPMGNKMLSVFKRLKLM